MTRLRDLLRAPRPVRLTKIDPAGTPGLPADLGHAKGWARTELAAIGRDLATLQEKLYAATRNGRDRRRLLVVLQAMDAGGKDGVVRHVGGMLNPLGLQVHSFVRPTAEELARHFLWRIRPAVPSAGHVGIFNRSHYEDVLIVRVHGLVPERTWRGRYNEINAFERELVDDGVILLKIMLHISHHEQGKRLLQRLDDPTRYWKYDPADLDERARWDDYQAAYADALDRCAEVAPWYVVPADRKWYRNWAVASLLREVLTDQNLHYPPPSFDVAAERARLLG